MSNPILKKELQLLKGPLVASGGLLLFVLAAAKWGNPQLMPKSTWVLVPFGLMLCYLITAAFGHELGETLFGTWMIQPKNRRSLWKIKLTSLGIAYITMSLLLGSSILLLPRTDVYGWTNNVTSIPFWLLWLPWMCFGPGIYFTLKLRNPTASFWLTGAIPALFIPTVWMVLDLLTSVPGIAISNPMAFIILVSLSLVYGTWGIWAAWRQFMTWEDLGLESKAIEFNFWKSTSKNNHAERVIKKAQSQVWTLITREIRLQQINVLFGFILIIFIWGIHFWHQTLIRSGESSHETEIIGMLPTVLRYLLFILPCSIAAMSIADIRRQDAHTWELMLPVSKRFQFSFKMLTCLFLGWLFAAGLPFTFDKNVSFLSTFGPYYHHIALWVITMAAFVIGAFSFYISSLTSSFLKSFSFSLALMPLMIFYLGFLYALANGNENQFVLGLFAVPAGIALVLSILTLWWSRSNFAAPVILKNHKVQNWKRWGWSSVIILIWFGIMIDRTWERVTMMEPKLMASEILTIPTENMDEWSKSNLLQQPGDSPLNKGTFAVHSDLGDYGRGVAIALQRDGRLSFVNPNQLLSHFHTTDAFKNRPPAVPAILSRNLFYSGEIATQAIVAETAGNYHHRFILDTKGRLWMWSIEKEDIFIRSKSPFDLPIAPTQLVEGTRFRNLTLTPKAVYAIDENNHLWRANYKLWESKITGDLEPLAQVFPEHQWKEITKCPAGMLGLKQDGTLWAWDNVWGNLGKNSGDEMIDISIPTTHIFGDRKWKSIHPQNKSFLAEDSEGSLWIPTHVFIGYNSNIKISNAGKRILCKVELPGLKQYISYETPSFGKSAFYWIREDGTLWTSEFLLENYDTNTDQDIIAKPTKSKQIGRRTDWVYITYFAGMTADGKIWNWDQPQLNPWNPFPARFRHKVVADLGK